MLEFVVEILNIELICLFRYIISPHEILNFIRKEALLLGLTSIIKCTFSLSDYRKLQKYIVGEYERLCTEVSLSPVYECLNEGVPKASIDDLNARFHIVKNCGKSELEIQSNMDMIYDRIKGKRNRTVFVKGEAGIGKSTWCLQVISTWCKTQTIHSSDAVEFHKKITGIPGSQQFCFAWCKTDKLKPTKPKTQSQSSLDSINESDNEKVPTFDFLFFVILRHIRDKLSILDMIFASELQRLSEFRPLVYRIMKEHSESVLIILDGISEYGQRLDYRGLNQCTVIATTRPWKYDVLCAENTVKIDSVFTIKGLKTDDIPETINNVIGLLNLLKKDSEESVEYNSDDNQSLTKDNDQNLTENCLQHVESIGMAENMTVPLTLLTVIQCWLENRESLPLCLTSSVLRLLKVIILRGEEKIPANYLLSYGTENANCVTLGRITSNVINDEVLTKYLDLFIRLGKLAFEGILLSTSQSLPFTECQILQYITKEELELCLQFGLITKSKMFDSAINKAREVVSFYHGILQELFAALWIVGNDEEVLSKLKIFNGISKLENVLIFLCGLSPSIGSKFTSTLSAICNRDSCVEDSDVALSVCKTGSYDTCVGEIGESVQICESDNWQKLTLLIMKCQKEVDESGGPEEDLYISNGVLKGKLNNCTLKVIKQSKSHLRSLELCYVTLSYQQMSQLCQSISSAVFLQKLDIAIFEIKHIEEDQAHTITLNLSNHNVLKTLKVCDSPEHCIKEIILGNNRNLESIAFVNVAMSQLSWNKCFESLASQNVRSIKLQQLTVDNIVLSIEHFMQLESLILENVAMSQIKLNDNTKLVELGLQNVTMTQSAWNTLFKAVSVTSLGKLTLWNINACCADAKAGNLAMVDTEGMTVESVRNNGCLTGMGLRDASFCSVTLCQSQWDCFSELFRYCWMHSLKLAHVNMKEGVLNLEKLKYLKLLSLNEVSVSEVKFGERLIVPNVSVTSVKMPRSSWESFCAKVLIGKMRTLSLKYLFIPTILDLQFICRLKMIQLKDLQLNDVDIYPFLDLRDVELRRISMPESAWRKVLESIKCQKMTNGMRTFCLESLNFEDAVIDLTSLLELEKLTLLDIKVSALKLGEKRKLIEMNMDKLGMGSVSWYELFRSLQVQTLRCLTITNIDFDDVEIDLETAKALKTLTVACVRASDLKLNCNIRLHKVELEDVTLQIASWPRLFQRLKSLKINKLTLRKLNVGKAIVSTNRLEMLQLIDLELKNIELGSVTSLRDADLRRITMPISAWKKFLESIRCSDMWKGIRTFSLESLNYSEAVIDLTNLLEIEKLKVLDIKVSGLKLGEKSKLTEMLLDKISMPKLAWNALFMALHVKALRHLTMENINIYDVKVNLESAKALTTLKVVSVRAFDLHICSNMSLQTVALENLILHKASWPGLFRRLKPLKLSELTLRSLDIGEAVIRIDKISHLQRLAVTDVNMSDECHTEVNKLLNNVRVHGKKSAR